MEKSAGATPRDVSVNGVTLRCTTWGMLTHPERVALLVHGLTSNSQAWNLVAPALADHGWFVIAPDLRGRGRSSKPAHGYSIPIHANDLIALCDAFGLPMVSMVGHSLGALITIFFAAVYQSRVNRIALVDAGARLPGDVLEAIAASVSRLDFVYPSLDAYLERMRQTPIHDWNDFWDAYYRYDTEVHADGAVTSSVSRATIDEEVLVDTKVMHLGALPQLVRVSTLIARATVGMLGPDRGYVLPADEAARLADTIADSRVVEILGANHYTILLAERLRQALATFLTGEPGRQPSLE